MQQIRIQADDVVRYVLPACIPERILLCRFRNRFSKEITDNIADVDMVYWDYYHSNGKIYDLQIKCHKKLLRPLLFAGGISNWYGQLPWHEETWNNSKAALRSCARNGVRSVFATIWGDDGCEDEHILLRTLSPSVLRILLPRIQTRDMDIISVSEFLTKTKFKTWEAIGSYHAYIDGTGRARKSLFLQRSVLQSRSIQNRGERENA